MKAIVIGAGPSGLLAAYLLAQQGYQVTVLEKEDTIGGRLKADAFSDGSTLAVGATWIHNSEHPIANILGNGVDQRDVSDAILKELCIFVEIMHKTLMDVLQETKDLAERQEIASLTWPTLIKALEKTEDTGQPTYIQKLKPVYQQYLRPLLERMVETYNQKHQLPSSSTITTLIEQPKFLKLLDSALQIDTAVLGGQHYLDSERLGSTEMIPKKGFHHLIEHLRKKITEEYSGQVKILTNHQVLRIQESTNQIKLLINCQALDAEQTTPIHYQFNYQQKSQTKMLSADKLIIAIAPNHYKDIRFSCDSPEIECATNHLHPSNFLKIAVLLDTKLNAANQVTCMIKRPMFLETSSNGTNQVYQAIGIEFTPETENSNILVGFIHTDLYAELKKLEEKENLETQLADELLRKGMQALETKRYYETGESWFSQKKGFLPIINKSNSRKIYLGTVTGCCDAVHSVLTNTCVQLGVNPKLLEKIFAAPQLRTQLAVQSGQNR